MTHEAGQRPDIRPYMLVFGALLVLTVVTVGVSYLELSVAAAVGLALLIASVKGSLVACYFMHLISERKLILIVMGVTVLLFFAVLFGPVLTEADQIHL